MFSQTNYSASDLESGICISCSQQSDEIYRYDEFESPFCDRGNDKRCIDCIEEQKFFDTTMKGI
jgi:hypothetical protein